MDHPYNYGTVGFILSPKHPSLTSLHIWATVPFLCFHLSQNLKEPPVLLAPLSSPKSGLRWAALVGISGPIFSLHLTRLSALSSAENSLLHESLSTWLTHYLLLVLLLVQWLFLPSFLCKILSPSWTSKNQVNHELYEYFSLLNIFLFWVISSWPNLSHNLRPVLWISNLCSELLPSYLHFDIYIATQLYYI